MESVASYARPGCHAAARGCAGCGRRLAFACGLGGGLGCGLNLRPHAGTEGNGALITR